MIYFVSTGSHRYTHAIVERDLKRFKRVSYPVLLMRHYLPRGVYIFSDFDRLSAWQLELAASVYRQLRDAGCPVLNDPARALSRLDFLRLLHRRKINSFKAWSPEEAEDVDHFPVFLRTQAAHRGVLTDLLPDRAALGRALARASAEGIPARDLMICEYRAEPVREGLFRKLSVYRVGPRTVAAPNVHERRWMAKYGEVGVADQALYDDEHRIVRDNPFGASVLRAFEVAGIDYGRADFGLVNGRPEIYEINSNPSISGPSEHPFPVRVRSMALAKALYLGALESLDEAPSGSHVPIRRPKLLLEQKRWLRVLPGYQWTP